MSSRLQAAVLALVMLLACSVLIATEPLPNATDSLAGEKSTERGTSDEVAAPATTEWGMFIMVLLVLTASTAAMLGGGVLRRGLVVESASAPELTREQRKVRRKFRRSARSSKEKNKSRRTFSLGRSRVDQNARQDAHRSIQARRRRRDGPGCRGIR